MTDMKKKLFGMAALALMASSALMVGCTKEDGNVFRLKIQQYGNAGKTIIGENGVTQWVNNDPLYVNGASETDVVNVQVTGENYTAHVESDPINGKYYFFYPGNCTVTGFDGTNKSFTYTMPNRITYNANALNAPMAGASNGQDVNFANICTMLKLEFPVVMPQTVEITSESTAICGEFTTTYGANGWEVQSPEATADNKTITITNSTTTLGTAIYVPLPAGNHKLTIKGKYFTKAMTAGQQLVMNTIYPITCAHAFSVSENKKVYFAPGNLLQKYVGGQYVVCFTDGQNVVYQANNLQTGAYANYDLWLPSTYTATTSFPQIPADLTTLTINGKNDWQILTPDEWTYVINGRGSTSRTKRFLGKVNNISGLFILPDDFQNNTGTSLPEEELTGNTNLTSTSFGSINMNTNIWGKFESLGVVFLPAAKYVNCTSSPTSTTQQIGSYGSTTNNYGLQFYKHINNNNHSIIPNNMTNANYAVSYRLVRIANSEL